MRTQYRIKDRVRLQIQEGWPDLPNLVPNPKPTTASGTWGWYGTTDVSLLTSATPGIGFLRTGGGSAIVRTNMAAIPESDGTMQTSAAWTYASGSASVFHNIEAFDEAGVSLGTSPNVAAQSGAGAKTIAAWTVPAGAVYLGLKYAVNSAVGTSLTLTDPVLQYGTAEEIAASDPLTEPAWIDIIGSTSDIEAERDELNVAILTATIRDAELDPSTDPDELIRAGKRCRVQALDASAAWDDIYNGVLRNAKVSYTFNRGRLKVSTTITATDAATPLAGASRPNGVGTIDELRAILAGTGVPWNVNGSSDGYDPDDAVIVAVNDSASALDQVAITRDSVLGYAWVDRYGVLQAWDASQMPALAPTLPNPSFDENVDGWEIVTGGTISHDPAVGRTSPGSLKLTGTTRVRMMRDLAHGFLAKAGKSYTIGGWAKAGSVSRTLRLRLEWRTSSGALIRYAPPSAESTVATNTSTWVQNTLTDTAPDGAAFGVIFAELLGIAPAELHYLDDFTVTCAGAVVPLGLDESDYSKASIDFDTERCINTVTVHHTQINPGTGETEEVTFGPYVDPSSVREWGAHAADFRVQGVDESAIPDFAAAILTANATPIIRINAVTLPLRTLTEQQEKAFLDLYDPVQVSNAEAGVVRPARITTIKHTIKAGVESDRWLIELGFSAEGSVASPQVTPSPTEGGQKTLAQLLRPVGEVTMWYGAYADIPAGWLPCDGTSFDGATYPELQTLLGGTTTPDWTDRMPIGAGTKALGTSGGSSTATLTIANLPAHDHPIAQSDGTGSNGNTVPRGNAVNVSDSNGPIKDTGSATPVDILNPWRAIWLIIRAA